LKKWADDYLADIARSLAVLDRDPREITPESRELLFAELEADQYLGKYNGDQDKAFLWAHLEKRRKLVSLLVKKVIVRLGKDRTRIIAPEVVVRIPICEAEILSYGPIAGVHRADPPDGPGGLRRTPGISGGDWPRSTPAARGCSHLRAGYSTHSIRPASDGS
jgi:hypothetical protein